MGIKSTTDKLLKGNISGVVSDVKYTIERTLGLNGVVIVTVAASIGSGLFVLPSFAAAVMGPGIWLAFLLAGIVFLPGTLSKSELASAMPENGGAYVYVERSFGPLSRHHKRSRFVGIVLVEVCVCFNRLLSVYVCPNKLL